MSIHIRRLVVAENVINYWEQVCLHPCLAPHVLRVGGAACGAHGVCSELAEMFTSMSRTPMTCSEFPELHVVHESGYVPSNSAEMDSILERIN